MRYAVVLAFLIIGAVVGALAYQNLTAGLPVVLSAPTKLVVSTGGGALQPDGWTNSATVDLKVMEAHTNAGADLEVRPVSAALTGSPTQTVNSLGQVAAACRTCLALTTAEAHIHLSDGAYHWQARLHSGQGISPWAIYRGIIRVDTTPPVIGQLASPTDPNPSTVYHLSTMSFQWQGTDNGSGINGYAYRLDHDAHGVPRQDIRTGTNSVTLHGLGTGLWYFHVRSLDRAGNWGLTSTFPVHIDVTPPGLAHVLFSRYDLDPAFQALTVSFAVTRPSQEVRVGIYRQSNNGFIRLYRLRDLKPGQPVSITWDGKGMHGRFVAAGAYEVYIRAIDPYGHASVAGWRDFLLNYKRIVVSLSQQKVTAYDGNTVFLTSLATTGNQKLPTPTGTFSIEGKFHPFTFHSPWPKSSPFYYPPSKTEWSMLFREGGYFIHDAPWRSNFGPGSNQAVGTPGQNYTGTHGCVNVPSDVAQKLFAWAQIGTVVQVVA